MAYLQINNYSANGKLGISTDAVTSIATKAVHEIEGVSIADKKGKNKIEQLFELSGGVNTTLANGKALVKMDVVLARNCDVREVCIAIQKKVAEAIHLACETLPCEVRLRVVELR